MKQVKVKICGLKRPEDIEIVNRYLPDYIGFIINFPKSHRSKTQQEVKILSQKVDSRIQKVGVFVNADPAVPIAMAQEGILDVIQLHGSEDANYIRRIQEQCGKPVIKAFTIHTPEDLAIALDSPADYILLDEGQGSGKTFDWNLLTKRIQRPFFMAGGITPQNIEEAYERVHPWGMDMSSGVETNEVKDEGKIRAIMEWRASIEREKE